MAGARADTTAEVRPEQQNTIGFDTSLNFSFDTATAEGEYHNQDLNFQELISGPKIDRSVELEQLSVPDSERWRSELINAGAWPKEADLRGEITLISSHPPYRLEELTIEPQRDKLLICKVSNNGGIGRIDVVDGLFDVSHDAESSTFPWIIGTNDESSSSALNDVCLKLFGKKFADVTLPRDNGLKKAFWVEGTLIGHISRFESEPDAPLKVKRHVIEILACKDGLIAVDHGGKADFLNNLKLEIDQLRIPSGQLQCVGGLAALIIERQLEESEKTLNYLERWVDFYGDLASRGPLRQSIAHEDVPQLMKSLEFFRRKVNQTAEVLSALEQSDKGLRKLFPDGDSTTWLRSAEQKMRNLIAHSTGTINKLNSIEEQHDRQQKAVTDRDIGLFTIAIGVSAPPIIGDLFCKAFLLHAEWLHPWVFVASMMSAAALTLWAQVPKWRRSATLRRYERNNAPDKIKREDDAAQALAA